jgi:hypothetical protein
MATSALAPRSLFARHLGSLRIRNGDDLSEPAVHTLSVIPVRTARGAIRRAQLVLQRKRGQAEFDDVRFRGRGVGGCERGTKTSQRTIIAH